MLWIRSGAEYHELANKGVLNIMIDLREGCFLSEGGAEYHEWANEWVFSIISVMSIIKKTQTLKNGKKNNKQIENFEQN